MSQMSSQTEGDPEEAVQRRFLPLWTLHQRRVFAYIYMLVPNRADAEDLLQETSITLWEKFDGFEPGTDFVAWACQVAYWKVRNARRKYARSPIIHDDDLLSSLSAKALASRPEFDRRHEALEACLKRLNQRDQRLVMSRYETGTTIKEAAERAGRSVDATYKALSRIRRALQECVSLRLERRSA